MSVFSEFLEVSEKTRRITREEFLGMTPSERRRGGHMKTALVNGWCDPVDVSPRSHDERYVEDYDDWTKSDPTAGDA